MNPMFFVFLAVVAVLAALPVLGSRLSAKKSQTLKAKLAQGAKILDVRTKAEFKGGAFPGARNLPLDSLGGSLKTLGKKDDPIVVYCASGGRSAQAAALLKSEGFTDVTDAGALAQLNRLD